MLPEWAFVNGLLLLTYWALDRRMYARETPAARKLDTTRTEPLRLAGAPNLLWFAVIVMAVALVPSLDIDAVAHGHIEGVNWVPWRELVMLGAAVGSYVLGSKRIRFDDNHFTFAPIAEVAALFVGIFLTMVPALQVLRELAPRLPLNEVTLFVFTGGLSAVLDNAPTYATFFEMSTQIAGEPRVADVPEALLVSISLGAVLCGALTYIGNGPNFMVKSVAESDGVAMPSFLGYVREAFLYLAPVLLAMALLFIATGIWSTIAGVLVLLALLIRCALLARTPRTASSSEESAARA